MGRRWPDKVSIRLIFSAVMCLAAGSPVLSVWPFPEKHFKGNALLGAGSLGLDPESRVVAFGDFNGDQFVDALMLGSDQQVVTTYLWDHEAFTFKRAHSFRHSAKIHNVVPGDFTHDGRLDLLISSQSLLHYQLDLSLYPGTPEGGFASSPISIPPSTMAEPIPFDSNGDMKIDLLGMSPSRNSLQLWKNAWNDSDSNPVLFNMEDPHFLGSRCTIANPHSNAVVDLNGDCLADVFLVCDDGRGGKYFQIWVNNKDAGFSLAQSQALPRGTQAITFADMNRDGSIDMVFSTCSTVSPTTGIGSDCLINVAYNQQLPLCKSSTGAFMDKSGKRACRQPEELCTADNGFKFDFTVRRDNGAFVQIPLSAFASSSKALQGLLVLDTTYQPPLPLPIRLGDADLDGFPDIFFIGASSTGEQTPQLLFSVPASSLPGQRTWHASTMGTESLTNIKDARGLAFVDLDEDGTLDMIVQRTGSQGEGTITFIQNNFYYDAFFLKAIVLNGACDGGWCENNGTRYRPFGVSYSGPTYKYTVLDTSGGRSAAAVGQLPQTSYHALLTPYSFFGLGRTNNYIENLFVGSTKHSAEHFINMEGVIPNSRVVINPPALDQSIPWKRELFLRPGKWIPWVTLTVVIATVILAIIVFVLHLNEKREDELERRRASYHINFDAL